MPLSVSQTVVVRLSNSRLPAKDQDNFADALEISARLKAARKKARLNQTELGKMGGVSLNTQSGYESGTLPPIDYFLRIAAAGIDWYWVVTGNRIAGEVLSDDVLDLVAAYRAMPPLLQAAMLRFARDVGTPTATSPNDES